MVTRRLRLVIFFDAPGVWIVRGLEHDLGGEARTVGEAVRKALQFVQAHTEFDIRHEHPPLAAFPPAPQKYWNAFSAGTPVPLDQLGIGRLPDWDIQLAFAAGGLRQPHSRQMSVRTHAVTLRARL